MFHVHLKPVHRSTPKNDHIMSVDAFDAIPDLLLNHLSMFDSTINVAVEDKYGIFFSKYIDSETLPAAIDELKECKQFTY